MSDLRRFMNIVESAASEIEERYTPNNNYFLQYMKGGNDGDTADPYQVWWEICEWLEDADYLDEVSALVSKQRGTPVEYHSADDLRDDEPDIFYLLPKATQLSAYEYAVEQRMQHDAAEAPTTAHMELSKSKLLHRLTWLVHFSDNADQIAYNGFKYGIDRMDTLGLTTHYSPGAKQSGGYNFAFLADSRHARYAAGNGKYGSDAVIFQNSGVHCYHYGDEEDQIVFWGADVDPVDIFLLSRYDGDWMVKPKARMERDYLYKSENFEDCVKWVMANHEQYRRALSGNARRRR